MTYLQRFLENHYRAAAAPGAKTSLREHRMQLKAQTNLLVQKSMSRKPSNILQDGDAAEEQSIASSAMIRPGSAEMLSSTQDAKIVMYQAQEAALCALQLATFLGDTIRSSRRTHDSTMVQLLFQSVKTVLIVAQQEVCSIFWSK